MATSATIVRNRSSVSGRPRGRDPDPDKERRRESSSFADPGRLGDDLVHPRLAALLRSL
jgi:hypothetical protein